MFKYDKEPEPSTSKEQIFSAALELFRTRGFDETTMREVATRAGTAVGAAYYYFPSKEAIVLSYYERVHDEHERRVMDGLAERGPRSALRERLSLALHSKIDIIAEDARLLGALFRYTGVPSHPLSFLGKATKPLRERGIELFSNLIADQKLPPDMVRLLPLALWSLHMGIMLYFLYDDSPGLKRTRRLIDGSLDFTEKLLKIISLPLLRSARKQVIALLDEAQLLS